MPSAVRWLLPAAACPPSAALRAGDGQRREVLETMRREGLLVHVVGGVYLPADVTADPSARAGVLRLVVPAGGVVGLVTAAWVLGAPVEPHPVDVLLPHTHGPRPTTEGVREHWTTLSPSDVRTIEGLRVTTEARTAADLARSDDERSLPALRWLLDGVVTERQVMQVLRANQRFRNNRRGRAVLRGLRAGRSALGRPPQGDSPRRPVSR